jgi:hypothetical protein
MASKRGLELLDVYSINRQLNRQENIRVAAAAGFINISTNNKPIVEQEAGYNTLHPLADLHVHNTIYTNTEKSTFVTNCKLFSCPLKSESDQKESKIQM